MGLRVDRAQALPYARVVDPASEIGKQIRARRQRLGLSLEALAKRSGVSSTMLSEVERSIKHPTVKLAYQIARALGVSLDELLSELPTAVPLLTPAHARERHEDPSSGVLRYRAGGLGDDSALELRWYEVPAGQSVAETVVGGAGTQERLVLVHGHLHVRVAEISYELSAGDLLTWVSPQRIYCENLGPGRAEFLWLRGPRAAP